MWWNSFFVKLQRLSIPYALSSSHLLILPKHFYLIEYGLHRKLDNSKKKIIIFGEGKKIGGWRRPRKPSTKIYAQFSLISHSQLMKQGFPQMKALLNVIELGG